MLASISRVSFLCAVSLLTNWIHRDCKMLQLLTLATSRGQSAKSHAFAVLSMKSRHVTRAVSSSCLVTDGKVLVPSFDLWAGTT